MIFAIDKNSAEFEGIKLFVEEYSFSRYAAVGETALTNGSVSFYNGGGKCVRITFSGISQTSCADILDGLLCGGDKITLSYAGMTFTDVILTGYSCGGKSGDSESVTVEFMGESEFSAESSGNEEVDET